jgi:glucose/arabinose dehydrogenase
MKRFLAGGIFAIGLVSLGLGWANTAAIAADEATYYTLEAVPLPKDVVLEVGALEFLPDGKLAVSTRRGEIWFASGTEDQDLSKTQWKRFAEGLHEVLGLAWKDNSLYATQRGELSRLRDLNGDGVADEFETVNDSWHINGDYHEYAFGSKFDKEGNIWVVLCLTGSFSSEVKFRGWCVRIGPDGVAVPTCSGIRSPGGIGANAEGDMFYTDNQGPWNGTCALKHLPPGKFVGHPGGNKWYENAPNMGPKPQEPLSGSRFMTEAAKIPEYEPPAILFPYQKMGQSASGIACDLTGGKFGPYQEQLFVGDQTHSTVMRCFLEKIDGHYQGACFPFRSGTGSGSLALQFSPQGDLFVGGTNRGWGSRGPKPFALDRIHWTGKTPFDIHKMEVQPDGFLLTFTKPVDPNAAGNPESYKMTSYTFIYQSSYGSPEVDHATQKITRAEVAADGLKVKLTIENLQPGSVHELHSDGAKSADGEPLLHPEAYYTLNRLPGQPLTTK